MVLREVDELKNRELVMAGVPERDYDEEVADGYLRFYP